MAEHLWMAAKEVTNVERQTDSGHQKMFTVKQVSETRRSEKRSSAGNFF